jgi:hypothetical protein
MYNSTYEIMKSSACEVHVQQYSWTWFIEVLLNMVYICKAAHFEVHVQQYSWASGLYTAPPVRFMYSSTSGHQVCVKKRLCGLCTAIHLGIRFMYNSTCEVHIQQFAWIQGLCTAAPERFTYSSTPERQLYLQQHL